MSHDSSILIYRIGQLGDTLVSLPALWAVRDHFSTATLTLLYEVQAGRVLVTAPDILAGSGLVDQFWAYRRHPGHPTRSIVALLQLWLRLRCHRFDRLIYLAPSSRSPGQVRRDWHFFRSAGIARIDGHQIDPAETVRPQAREYELLLNRLALSAIPTPPPNRLRFDLPLQPEEQAAADRWSAAIPDGGCPWVAFGPGSNMPAKCWPAGRFAELGRRLIDDYDIWPVVFGGPADQPLAEYLVGQWGGRGTAAAGQLTVRQASAALARCRFFVGNDTGSMHLAAAAGLRCVALFSNRDRTGKWRPAGPGHQIIQNPTACQGCLSQSCPRAPRGCIDSITVDQVYDACRRLIETTCQSSAAPMPAVAGPAPVMSRL